MQVTPDLLLRAYQLGIFPMADHRDGDMLYWLSPKQRGVFFFDSFYIPQRLKRVVRKGSYQITVDRAFDRVLDACAAPAPDRPHTWINEEIQSLYQALHQEGSAHSVEYWIGDTLLGGLYGVKIGACFFGESMFSHQRDASKIALVHLVARLTAGGFLFLDTQFVTPHLRQFGAREVPRECYVKMVQNAVNLPAEFLHVDLDAELERLLTPAHKKPCT